MSRTAKRSANFSRWVSGGRFSRRACIHSFAHRHTCIARVTCAANRARSWIHKGREAARILLLLRGARRGGPQNPAARIQRDDDDDAHAVGLGIGRVRARPRGLGRVELPVVLLQGLRRRGGAQVSCAWAGGTCGGGSGRERGRLTSISIQTASRANAMLLALKCNVRAAHLRRSSSS